MNSSNPPTDSENIGVIVERLIQIKEAQSEIRNDFQRAVDEIKTDIKELKKQMTDGYASKEELSAINERLKKQEAITEWAGRIVIGAVLLAILGLVLIQK